MKVDAADEHVIFTTVGVTATVGVVKFCDIVNELCALHVETGFWPITVQIPGCVKLALVPVRVPPGLVHV